MGRDRCLIALLAAGVVLAGGIAFSDSPSSPWPAFRHDAQHTGRSAYVGPVTGIAQWYCGLGGSSAASPAVAGGRVYAVGGGRLAAVGLDGSPIWSANCGSTGASSPAVAADGTIYVASTDSNLYAFNPDGSLKWKRAIPGLSESSPSVGTDGTVYVGCSASKLLAYRADGTLKWSYSAGGAVVSSPALAADGTVYFGCDDGALYAVKSTGTLKWKFTTSPAGAVKSSPAVGSDGTVYFGCMNGFFYAVWPTGTQRWRFGAGAGIYSSPAIGPDGSLVFGSRDRYIYCLTSAGALKWKLITGQYVDSSPAVDANGVAYVGSNDGSVYAVRADGTVAWSSHIGNAVLSSPAIDDTGTVYVTTQEGNLCALRGDSTPPMTPVVIDDGAYTTSLTTIHAAWTSADPESGIAHYEYAVGISPGGQDVVPFTNAGLATEITRAGLSLMNGADYYVSVRATNGAGLVSAVGVSDGIRVDSTPPVVAAPEVNASIQEIRVRVTGSDPESGISQVQCVMLTSPTLPPSPNWVSGSPGNEIVLTGPYDVQLTYYVAARALNNAGLWSTAVVSAPIRMDTTPPTTPVVSDDGVHSTSVSSLHATWTASDPESGIDHYSYCIGTARGASDVKGWTDTGYGSVTVTGLTLTNGSTYYFTVRAVNHAGLVSADGSSNGITVDSTPPTDPIVTDDGDTTSVPDCLHVTVYSTDPESGVIGYTYSVGTSPEGADVVAPTQIANLQSVTVCGLSMQPGTRYYFTFTAVNRAGLVSRAGTSDGIEYQRGVSTWWKFRADGRSTGRSQGGIPLSGIQRWRVQTGGYVESSPAIGGDGTAYVGSSDGKLYAISAVGTVRWTYQTASWIDSSPAIASDGSIYVGANDGLYCLSVGGTLRWKLPTSSMVWSSPAIGPDGTIYFGCHDRRLYAVSPAGVLKWSYLTGGEVWSSPAVAPDGTIYFASGNGKLYALTPAGALKWAYATGSAADSSPAIGDDGTVYFGSGDGYFYAISPDGTRKWRADTGQVVDSSAAVAEDGTIYVGTGGAGYPGKLVAFSKDGAELWRAAFPEGIRSSPVVDKPGNVCVGCANGKVYVLDRMGHILWSSSAGNSIFSSPAVGADGALVIGSDDGCVYCFRDRMPLDTTPPTAPVVSVQHEFITPDIPIAAWWSSSDPESGVESCSYAIGTQPQADDVVSWTNAGAATSMSRSGLPLVTGRAYYVSVRAVNYASLTSAIGVSKPITVIAGVEANTIGGAKKRPVGTQVTLPGKIVTAVFDDCFFVEEPNRSAGIRCVAQTSGLQAGSVVSVQGTVSLRYGETVLTGVTVTPAGFAGSVQPLGMPGELLVKIGLDPSGLLLRVSGRVVRTGASYFVFSDGSCVQSPRGVQGLEARLTSQDAPAVGAHVAVVGVACRELVNSQVTVVLRAVPGSQMAAY